MNSALFLLLDVIPDYLQKTFRLDSEGKPQMSSWYPTVVREGEGIPDGLRSALVIYNESIYHAELARHLVRQIEALNPQACVVALPVWG